MKKISDIFKCDGTINPKKLIVPGSVYYFKETESTNKEAKLTKNVPDRSLFIAERQTGGRGRLGRSWSSPAGCGIWASICLEPDFESDISQLTLAAGLAVCRVIKNSKIKWPNDVLLGDKKVCGVLCESVMDEGKISRVIVGIGINVNTKSFDVELADKATSIYIETGKKASRERLLNAISKEFFCIYDGFIKGGFGTFRDEYIKNCVTLFRDVILVRDGLEIPAKAIDITEKGELLVEIGGVREAVNAGEVSVRGLLGYN